MAKKEGHKNFLEEQKHILNILKRVKQAIEKNNYVEIKNRSNHMLHHASIHQQPDIVSLTVIIYALSKLIERENYKKEKKWPTFYSNYLKHFNKIILALENDNMKVFRNEINLIRQLIDGLSGDLKKYIGDVFRDAKINKASRIYEHGISMEKTAKILGISLWELSEYVGRTGIGDVNLGITMPVKQRIKIAEELFA